MRILAIAFALSLIGCVDDTNTDSDPTQEDLDDIDPTDDTDNRPNDSPNCDPGSVPGGGITNVSRKKADGPCQ